MQEGLIVYVVGGQEVPESLDLPRKCQELGLRPDLVALVASNAGFFSVEEAWHHLIIKGMGRVSLLVAQMDANALHPIYPPVRLWG
jgi:hypothetical protein